MGIVDFLRELEDSMEVTNRLHQCPWWVDDPIEKAGSSNDTYNLAFLNNKGCVR